MDTQQQPFNTTITYHTIPPAQLWVGQHEHVLKEVKLFLQKVLCPHNGCHTCNTCMHIRDKQHHSIMWLYPDKTYTLEQLDGLFSTIAYMLGQDETFFFVIQKADFLTSLCANKLLKPMEEPPAGYHFILLAEHIENILPTIRSRCVLQTSRSRIDNYINHPLFQSFTTQHCSPAEFSKILDGAGINERESVEIFNEILHYWLKQFTKNATTHHFFVQQKVMRCLKNVSKQLPMPGSSVIFWRNFYLSCYPIITELQKK